MNQKHKCNTWNSKTTRTKHRGKFQDTDGATIKKLTQKQGQKSQSTQIGLY